MVEVNGKYITAKHPLAAGDTITAADIVIKEGLLNHLPKDAILAPRFVTRAVSLRTIAAGQPLTHSMLRRAWVVHAGQSVQILAQGEGFNIGSKGRAMNNAAAAENVRIRMVSGQIIHGIAGEDGVIRIVL